jgi:hypothetical protein
MTSLSIRALTLATALSAGAMFSACSTASAQSQFNGNWSVVIYTTRGACDPSYRTSVYIQNGHVSGSGGVNVAGRVSASGQVRVSVSSGEQSASGSGRLSVRGGVGQGSGTWSGRGSQGTCAGTWVASR